MWWKSNLVFFLIFVFVQFLYLSILIVLLIFCCKILINFKFQVFEAEKMNTKKGMYHKKCFACISCKSQLHYYGAIEGPDDEVNYFFTPIFE